MINVGGYLKSVKVATIKFVHATLASSLAIGVGPDIRRMCCRSSGRRTILYGAGKG